MKKMICLLLAALMVLSMTACGETAPDVTEAPATEAPATEAPATEAPATEAPATEAPATEAPATEAPELGVDLQQVYDTIAEQMPEMVLLDETMMLNFCGIDASYYVQAVVATCADGLRTDEIWLIQAVNEDALNELKTLAESRLTAKGEESISYSPEQYAVVEKAQLLTSGLYLMLIVSPDVDALAEIASAAIG